jgi:hypothetical protein
MISFIAAERHAADCRSRSHEVLTQNSQRPQDRVALGPLCLGVVVIQRG